MPRPGDPQSLNWYSYARNSPLARVDLTGHADVCNSALYSCGAGTYSSNLPAYTLPSPNVVTLDPWRIQRTFLDSRTPWDDIPADYQIAMVSGNPGSIMPSVYAANLGGSAKELPKTEHPGTWLAAGVAGGYACVVFCGTAVTAISTAWTSLGAACATSNICLQLANLFNGITGASSGGNQTTRLYRMVIEEEYQDIMRTGVIQETQNSLSGMFFATTTADAQLWGERIPNSQSFRVMAVDISSDVVKDFMYWPKLDGIGPAYYATIQLLHNHVIWGEVNGN